MAYDTAIGLGIAQAKANIRALLGTTATWNGVSFPCTFEAPRESDAHYLAGFGINTANADIRVIKVSPTSIVLTGSSSSSSSSSTLGKPDEGQSITLFVEDANHTYQIARCVPMVTANVVHTFRLTVYRKAISNASTANTDGTRKGVDVPKNSLSSSSSS